MMRLPFLIGFSVLAPVLLRPIFTDNVEYFIVCALFGVLYGTIAGLVKK